MSTVRRVALTGFTTFERATFESFFRLAQQRTPAYVLADTLKDCDCAVVNADDEAGVAEVMRQDRMGRALMLGATPRPGAAQQLPRPINLMLVVRALDVMAMQPPALSKNIKRVLDDLMSLTSALPPRVDTRALAATAGAARPQPLPVPLPVPLPAAAAPLLLADGPEHLRLDHILVVDGSDEALRFMATHLQRFGFQVHLARSGTEAIDRVARRHFEFVFLDVLMDGLDGFHTCKVIKRNTYPDNRPPPMVVLLTRPGASVDRMRGTMAGADGYLTKPLIEADLLKVVGDREVTLHAYADTADGSHTLI